MDPEWSRRHGQGVDLTRLDSHNITRKVLTRAIFHHPALKGGLGMARGSYRDLMESLEELACLEALEPPPASLIRKPLAKHSQNESRGARQQGGVRLKIAFAANRHYLQLELGGRPGPLKMIMKFNAHLDGQGGGIEGPFRAIAWLSLRYHIATYGPKIGVRGGRRKFIRCLVSTVKTLRYKHPRPCASS